MGGPNGVSNPNMRPIVVNKPPVADKAPAAAPTADAKPAGAADGFDASKSTATVTRACGKNDTPNTAKSASGTISADQWADPVQIVSKLTQYPAGAPDAQSEAACSASNMIGAALMSGGPDAAASMLDKVAKGKNQLGADEKKELGDIAERIRNRTASFEDLNRAQVLTYRSANTVATVNDLVSEALEPENAKNLSDGEKAKLSAYAHQPAKEKEMDKLLTKALGRPVVTHGGLEKVNTADRRAKDTSGLTDGELKGLAQNAVKGSQQIKVGAHPGKDDTIEGIAGKLKPGEAVTLRVGASADSPSPDHYVTVGRRKDGTYYMYNPDPRNGDATLVVGGKKLDPGFLDKTKQYDDRIMPDIGADNLPPGLKYAP